MKAARENLRGESCRLSSPRKLRRPGGAPTPGLGLARPRRWGRAPRPARPERPARATLTAGTSERTRPAASGPPCPAPSRLSRRSLRPGRPRDGAAGGATAPSANGGAPFPAWAGRAPPRERGQVSSGWAGQRGGAGKEAPSWRRPSRASAAPC